MQLFYSTIISNNLIRLENEEFRHAVKVLRLKIGDIINVTDGLGNLYKAEVASIEKHFCEALIIETQKEINSRNYKFHLAIAPTKNIDRIEWLLEKATEIGIDEISFLLCEKSERKNINHERLLRIAESAMKQSLKTVFPIVNQLIEFKTFVKQPQDLYATKLIAHCGSSEKNIITQLLKPKGSYCVLIGPEGDFSEKEIALAIEQGFLPVSLGNARLRTETAGLLACSLTAGVNFR
jgi:16S rRNA (uracil1498-N3)-methyltransferase